METATSDHRRSAANDQSAQHSHQEVPPHDPSNDPAAVPTAPNGATHRPNNRQPLPAHAQGGVHRVHGVGSVGDEEVAAQQVRPQRHPVHGQGGSGDAPGL